MLLGHRRAASRAVHLGARHAHEALHASGTRCFEEAQGPGGVDFVVLFRRVQRVAHAETGEMKDDVGAVDERWGCQARRVPDNPAIASVTRSEADAGKVLAPPVARLSITVIAGRAVRRSCRTQFRAD